MNKEETKLIPLGVFFYKSERYRTYDTGAQEYNENIFADVGGRLWS